MAVLRAAFVGFVAALAETAFEAAFLGFGVGAERVLLDSDFFVAAFAPPVRAGASPSPAMS
ncbi:MAG: hypothetical protein AAGA22_03165 [Pseudomonadota bacterium]